MGVFILGANTTFRPVEAVFFSCICIYSNFQNNIVYEFESRSEKIRMLYNIEIIAGLIGGVLWYTCSVFLGLKGYLVFVCSVLFADSFLHKTGLWPKLLCFIAVLACCVLDFSPQPLINKRHRTEILKKGVSIGHFWEPVGHVEFVKMKKMILVLFEGGELRSNVLRFDGNYSALKEKYLRSESHLTWGLDVILPHYTLYQSNSLKRVALISSMGGQEIIAAKTFGAKDIFAIDINHTAQDYIANELSDWSGGIYQNVNRVHQDGRYFIEKSNQDFDLIQIYSAHNATWSANLGHAFSPTSLVNLDAVESYISHLRDHGILHITQNEFNNLYNIFLKASRNLDFDLKGKILVIKREQDGFNLTSFYFKKNGWSLSEIEKTKRWLSKDKIQDWVILVNPFEKTSLSFIDTEKKKVADDNWPFYKITSPLLSYVQTKILLLVFFLSLTSLFWLIWRKQKSDLASSAVAALTGICFSSLQPILIFILQRSVGNPSLGLVIGFGTVMITSLLGFLFENIREKFYSHKRETLCFLFFLIILSFFDKNLFLILLLVAAGTLQSYFFIQNMFSKNVVNYFLLNALGALCGLAVFHLVFIFTGFWQTIIFYLSLLFCAYRFHLYGLKRLRVPL
jgi:hypothetical protein